MAQGNFGADAGWEVSPRDQEMLARYVAAPGGAGADGGDTSFDDLFDGAAYRAAQTTFAGQANPRAPHGQSFYRAAVAYEPQGMARVLSSAHWAFLPDNTLAGRGGAAGPGGAGGRPPSATGPRPGQTYRVAARGARAPGGGYAAPYAFAG